MSTSLEVQVGPAWLEAATLADRYNWPVEAKQLRQGFLPEGFGREVGKTIALFLERPVVGWSFIGWSPLKAREYEQKMREHARVLARLRVLLASLWVLSQEQA